MRRIIVMNGKGGCGKTTVAVNLASRYAGCGYSTALFDYDPAAAARHWLSQRPRTWPVIASVAAANTASTMTRAWQLRVPPDTQRIIVDTPAAAPVNEMLDQLRTADAVLVPVLPSPIDIHTTADFIRDLLLIGKLRQHRTRIGIVANRLRRNTRALEALERFLAALDIPVVTRLRDTQRYLHATEEGLGVHELKGRGAYADRVAWDGVLDWLERRDPGSLADAFTQRLRRRPTAG